MSQEPGDRGPYEIQRMLVLSTGHITREEMERLNTGPIRPPVKWRDDYGVGLVVLPDGWVDPAAHDAEQALGPNVAACLKLARALGCHKVNFDMDGPEVADLPVFDW